MHDLAKSPDFIVRSDEPFCGGPPLYRLVERPLTWREDFFVRNHGTIPDIDEGSYRLVVDGMVRRPLSLSMHELASLFAPHEAVVTLQCAGNRRDELMAVAPITGEVPWGAEAVGNARWSGVSLADVLSAAGVDDGAAHVAFEGLDQVDRLGLRFGFGGSISLARALAGDVLLADSMNGENLPREHGAPLRVVVPGYIGARSVKWLGRITVQTHVSDNHFEARTYKLLPADADLAKADWAAYEPIEEAQLHAVICRPAAGAVLAAGEVEVEGYATAGGHRRVAGVDLALAGGPWQPARLLERAAPGAWVRWRESITLPPGEHDLLARATDSEGDRQNAQVQARWNPKGYMNDGFHRVRVVVAALPEAEPA